MCYELYPESLEVMWMLVILVIPLILSAPALCLPMTIICLIYGIRGLKGSKRGMAIAGTVLCIIGLVFTVVNSTVGFMLGIQDGTEDTSIDFYTQSEELDRLKSELAESDSVYEKTKEEHTRIRTWSEIFDKSSLETQKMVATSLINEVRMYRGYIMEIDFNISVKEFVDGISFDEEGINIAVAS